jgi:hypothetical protein
MSIKCEKEKDLSVCLHYQLINEITSSMWQMALKIIAWKKNTTQLLKHLNIYGYGSKHVKN